MDQEKELVEAAQRGSQAAMGRLYDTLFPGVYAYARSRLPSQSEAEDCVADVFLTVVRQLQRFRWRRPGSFQAWVFQITRSRIADFYRHRSPTGESGSLERLPDGQSGPEERLLRREARIDLLAHIQSLSPRRREVILLRYFGGLRNIEIAEVLKLDERTVASHLSRALGDLQERLRQSQAEGAER